MTKTHGIMNKQLPYYVASILFFVFMKFWYTSSQAQQLSFLLKPINALFSLAMGAPYINNSNGSFSYPNLGILIDKSCAGFNFWLLSFMMLLFLFYSYANHKGHRWGYLFLSLAISYIATILVNTSRIVASVKIQRLPIAFVQQHAHIVHESIGVITNLTFLILLYI
jgi:exosortase K